MQLSVDATQKLWLKPGKDWLNSTLKLDVIEITDTLVRKTFLQEFLENQAQFFTPNNMNKILASLGPKYHSALKDAVFKMQTGKAIPEKPTETSIFWNWFRGAVSGTMFFNSRSASLQLLSTANFINYKENNIFAAAKAFANLPQFIKDFKTIYNSPYLVSRRGGLRTEIDFAEFKEIFDKKRGMYPLVYCLQSQNSLLVKLPTILYLVTQQKLREQKQVYQNLFQVFQRVLGRHLCHFILPVMQKC